MAQTVEQFRELHKNTTPIRLPNAWDAASAALFESLGASAIATTSAGVAWTLGYQDGRKSPVNEVVAAAARMIRVLKLPLSWDIENGYSDDPKIVAGHVMRLVELGVAGINIEDGADNPALLASKIVAIRASLSKASADLFINARSDVFLASLVSEDKLVTESISRGNLYARAGADGLFLPGIHQADHIKAVVVGVALPLNAMAWPNLPESAVLGQWGVRRLSAGSGISQALWGRAEALAKDFLETGRSDALAQSSMPYRQLQNLFRNS
ncbi:MAG TPA: isocitrate lyase/phosphoenolpyruvate mutase family protein [Steroidobacteraceae bacterium]